MRYLNLFDLLLQNVNLKRNGCHSFKCLLRLFSPLEHGIDAIFEVLDGDQNSL